MTHSKVTFLIVYQCGISSDDSSFSLQPMSTVHVVTEIIFKLFLLSINQLYVTRIITIFLLGSIMCCHSSSQFCYQDQRIFHFPKSNAVHSLYN
jgi:hypothetical protein